MAEKKTIFQTLANVLNSEVNPMSLEPNKNNISVGEIPQDKGLITADNKEDFELKKLEYKQQEFLTGQGKVVSNDRYQLSVFYETTRYASYVDFEMMEYFPEIAAALDIISEESTCLHDNGKMLDIRSNSERIKNILDHLFYSILNINANLPAWVRNTAKYGDNFLYIESKKGVGITGCQQLTNIEIKRVEGNIFKKNEKKRTTFEWKKGNLEFQNFQVAHFRLIGDDKKLPYGTSMVEKARKIWKMLCLDSNSKIWTPNGYTLIKNLNIGDEVFSYNYEKENIVKSKVKNIINTGKKDTFLLKTNTREIKLTEDHPILIFDGKNYSYKNINEINLKKDFLIAPTIKDGLSEFNIQLESSDYYFKLNKKINYEKIGIMQKLDGLKTSKKNAHGFIIGNKKINYDDFIILKDRLNISFDDVDLYFKNSINKSILDKSLSFRIDDNFIEFFGFMIGDGWLTKRGIGFCLSLYENINNNYINYCKSIGLDKQRYNVRENTMSQTIHIDNKEINNIFKKVGFISGFAKKVVPKWIFTMHPDVKIKFIKGVFDADGSWKDGRLGLTNKNLIDDIKVLCETANIKTGDVKINKIGGDVVSKSFGYTMKTNTSYRLYINFNNRKEDFRLEGIKSIDLFEKNGDVWDIEIDNELHNFIADGLVVHNCLAEDAMMVYRLSRAPERRVFKIDVGNIDDKDVENYVQKISAKFKKTTQVNQQNGQIDLRYNVLSQDEDYFIPTRNGQNGTVIDTLAGAANLSDIADISFLQNKLFAALRVPKTFLGFAEATGDGKNLSMQDVRFARTINRVQQAMLMELNKIALIHLTLLGFSEERNNFTLTLANPSSQAEMLKLELLGIKLDTYIKAVADAGNGWGAMSMTKAKKEILNMSEDEIVLDLQQQRLEKAEALRNSPEVLATKQLNSGMFNTLDKRYKDNGESVNNSLENPEGGGAMGGGGSPAIGGGGGGLPPMPGGDEENPEGMPDINGGLPPEGESGMPPAAGGPNPMGGGNEEPIKLKEGKDFLEKNNILKEDIRNTMKVIDRLINN